MPVCNQNDLYLEANTMPAPPYGAAVIRVILYPQKKDYACRIETFVNFRLESENGELLSIEGNNGVAFSTGYTLA